MQSVSGHKAIFFSGSKPLAHGHFLSITNAVYRRNAVSDCRSRLSISGSKPLALPGHFLFGLKATGTSWPFLFGLKATGTSWPFPFWAPSHWHMAIFFISITNANYGLNAAWHKAFFFS